MPQWPGAVRGGGSIVSPQRRLCVQLPAFRCHRHRSQALCFEAHPCPPHRWCCRAGVWFDVSPWSSTMAVNQQLRT